MPLNELHVSVLDNAIQHNTIPTTYFDFINEKEVTTTNLQSADSYIHLLLNSKKHKMVTYGLANVLYWGYAQKGFRDMRVKGFMDKIKKKQAEAFQGLIQGGHIPTFSEIKALKLPEYSGIASMSKLLTFLDPIEHCVLDQQIARLGHQRTQKALRQLKLGQQLVVTKHNQQVYDNWKNECQLVSQHYFRGRYRAADIERGFSQLILNDELEVAQEIYTNT